MYGCTPQWTAKVLLFFDSYKLFAKNLIICFFDTKKAGDFCSPASSS